MSNDITYMVNIPAQIPDFDSYSLALQYLFLSSDTIIYSTMAFHPLGNSDHVDISVSIEFPINSKQDIPFHCIACDYSCADWDDFCDHLRDVLWDDIFEVSASIDASEFCGWVKIRTDVYIRYHKYQVKPHTSLWSSAAFAAAIVYRNNFFLLYHQNKSF